MMPTRSTALAVAAAAITFIVVYLAEAATPLSPNQRLWAAVAFSGVTLLAMLAAGRILWNAPARATALLIASMATCLSGVLTLVAIGTRFGQVAGWSAIATSGACAVMFLITRAAARDG